MWQRREVNPNCAYSVALRQFPDGRRRFSLCEPDSPALSGEVFRTQIVPTDLLLRRDFISISEQVPLVSGQSFTVDAHGTWLTGEEAIALDSMSFNKVPWLNGLPPDFAPR